MVGQKYTIRTVGDVHNKLIPFVNLVKDVPYSLQVGDMGFDYTYLRRNLDNSKHRFFPGNHDNYTKDPNNEIFPYYMQPSHSLGDFGHLVYPGIPAEILNKTFFIRGGRSIDRNRRTFGIDWWPEEELDFHEMNRCAKLYMTVKPTYVFSHECPASLICPHLFEQNHIPPSCTAKFLDHLLTLHVPTYWVFGHFHLSKKFDIRLSSFDENLDTVNKLCTFQCLAELEYVDITLE